MPGVMDGTSRALVAEVDYATKQGTELLHKGEKEKALGLFQLAHNKAQQLKDAFTKRSCAFNLGAVYIALGHPNKAIKLLQQALPPPNKRDGKSNGDLFYNFGLAYEALSNHEEAAKYYELALEEYQSEGDNVKMEGEVSSRTGQCHMRTNQWLHASRSFGIAATAHGRVHNIVEEANCRCRQASSLYQGQRAAEASNAADHCMILCQKITHGKTLGRLYNELGLTYTQCHEFAKAAMCFELALPSSRGPKADQKQEAVITQNLGAVYNSLGDYQRALQFHQKAAAIHAQLGNRNSQGQCFANLAFAFSQLGEQESSGEFYLHALQAAKDTDDLHGQWQAMEGLGAVAFNDGETEKASKYFRQALAALSKCEENKVAKERILTKLSDALGSEANSEISVGSHVMRNTPGPINPVNVLVNDRPRPPSRQEMLQMQYLRQQRDLYKERFRNEFKPIAHGLGAYDELSDSSFARSDIALPPRQKSYRNTKRNRRHRSGFSESEVWDERTRPTTARGPRTNRLVQSVSEPEMKSEPAISPKRTSVSQRQYKGDMLVQRRMKKRPLLRSEGHDSEEEWREHLREIKSDSSDEEYRERLRPPSRMASRNGTLRQKRTKWTNVDHFRKAMKNLVRSALSDPDEPSRGPKINRKRFAGDVGQSRPRSGSEGSDILPNLEPEQESKIEEMIDAMTDKIMEATSLISGKIKDTADGKKDVAHNGDTIKEEDEESEEEGTEDEEEKDREAQMRAYEESLREKRKHKEKKEELYSSIPHTHAPPVPLASTYEIPVSSEDHPAKNPGENFFRTEEPRDEGGETSHSAFLPACGEVSVDNSAMNPRVSKYVEDEDEPIYQTIRTLKSTQPQPQPHASGSASPDLPPDLPPRSSDIYKEEREAYPQQYQRETNTHFSPGEDTKVEKSVKEQKKTSSKTCIVM